MWTLLLAAMPLAAMLLAITLPDLEKLHWKHRVVLMSSPDPANPSLERQRTLLSTHAEAMRERDMVVYEVTGGSPEAKKLRQHLRIEAGFTVILIGKDGGEKFRSGEPLEAEQFFRLIDAMPMRRGEIRRR